MQQNAEKFVNLMVDILQKGVENIPPYVSDLLFRYSMMKLAYVIIGIGLLILGGVLRNKASKIEAHDDKMFGYVIGIFLSIAIGAALVFHNLQDVFIPELGIISLLRGAV